MSRTAALAATEHFARSWAELLPLGLHPATGGYRRPGYGTADLACREWFTGAATALGLDVELDRNANLWAWWGVPPSMGSTGQPPEHQRALVIGSHLDSVPDGGAFDGPLGVVSSLAAVAGLRAEGFTPSRPVAVSVMGEEEGSRFGIACIGSRLLTGALRPEHAGALRDVDGVSVAEALAGMGVDPLHIGPDQARLASIGAYVELHVEQGRSLVHTGQPVGVADRIWPHGRYRLEFRGRADHAGATLMGDRVDPVLTLAATILIARQVAAGVSGDRARATIGRITLEPGATNAIASRAIAWLDARAADEATLHQIVDAIAQAAIEQASGDGTGVDVVTESTTAAVVFGSGLRQQVAAATARALGLGDSAAVPVLPTAAGHDAGILASVGVPSAMLFVRNPTGISHSPAEYASDSDCAAGVEALVELVRDIAGPASVGPAGAAARR